MSTLVKWVAGILALLGGVGVIGIDILATIWLFNTHGIGWVIAAWGLVLPLFVIPFLAGYGLAYALAMGAWCGGIMLGGLADTLDEETRT